jgi:hypothetical protein
MVWCPKIDHFPPAGFCHLAIVIAAPGWAHKRGKQL